jgi:hypothetical protein
MNWTNAAFWIAAQCHVLAYGEGICGIAKTATGEAAKSYLGLTNFLKIKLDGKSPDDFEIPTLVSIKINGVERPAIRSVLTEELQRARHEPTLIMFDELPQASHQVLGYVQEDWFNKIPECSMCIATGNPLDRATSGQPLPEPVVNRSFICEWEFDNEAWLEGMGNCYQYPEPNFPKLPANWRDYADVWGMKIKSFLRTRPDLIQWKEMAPDAEEKAANDGLVKPFGSPRSWENLGFCLGGAESVGAEKTIFSQLAKGTVGEHGEEFLVWVVQQNLPDPRDILAAPQSLVLPARFDLARAIVAGVRGAVLEDGTPEMWESGLDVLEVIWTQKQEIAMSAHKAFWMCKPIDYTPNERTGIWDEIVHASTGQTAGAAS